MLGILPASTWKPLKVAGSTPARGVTFASLAQWQRVSFRSLFLSSIGWWHTFYSAPWLDRTRFQRPTTDSNADWNGRGRVGLTCLSPIRSFSLTTLTCLCLWSKMYYQKDRFICIFVSLLLGKQRGRFGCATQGH